VVATARTREDTRLNEKTAPADTAPDRTPLAIVDTDLMPTFEFHVSRRARDRYQFDDTLFTITGNVVFANFRAARVFAQKMNEQRDLVTVPEQAVKPGQINAMGLIDEIMHYLTGLYRQDHGGDQVMRRALTSLEDRLGSEAVDRALRRFADAFPTVGLYRRDVDLDTYLSGETAGTPNRQIVLEELLMLWLANANPAFSPFLELFDDADLRRDTAYLQVVEGLRAFFAAEPPFGPESKNLTDELRAPAIAVPHSLEGQLDFILQRWGSQLGQYVYRLLSSLDVIKEERKLIFLGPGPTQVPVYDFSALEAEGEPERFSPELGWMPSLVLMAKNTYVWMDQLSRKYQRQIDKLDQIPDEELDDLARWGFSGLWLIGVWERSPASQRIKVLCGNPDAVPSAYSLYDYTIADDLGGEAAYQNLKDRAWQRGIRMASDMVPNHVGIVSRWTIEHPDWFVSLDENPYPWYTYGGPDLSNDDRVGVFIEDHYYDRTDAAVTFKRVDRWTGQEKYVYHGNDGTSMPWNDTAQLNYLNPEVREAVIQTILHVARQFPVIRFDAAMTLAKRHFQRLWFPEPGSGGAIPTRAEHGLTRDQFSEAMPAEFWREVVDRVAAEAPDTLLLAEAFWLLEGYFVRTLGMHRVYNSAFMNMLRDEENAKYRRVMKNTLEFDPEVLRRFVNFMNNPDERTAVDQFGKDDKYFGVCTVLVTMPGLPMFGHGQVEGYGEKYGMEFRRPLWDETPDQGLIERHEREIFPLMQRRPLFAGVENFLLYDFFTPDGTVNEDVFAYSNRLGDERALVLYHNRFADARGWVRTSAAFAQKTGRGDEKVTVQRSLAEGLGLESGDDWFSVFRDQGTGLEYIRRNTQLRAEGMYVELGAYKRHVFVGFRQVQDTAAGQYRHLESYLEGRGVPSVEDALREIRLQPIRRPYEELVGAAFLRRLLDALAADSDVDPDSKLLDEVGTRLRSFLEQAKQTTGGTVAVDPIVEVAVEHVRALLSLPVPTATGANGTDRQVNPGVVVVDGTPVPADQADTVLTRGGDHDKPGVVAQAAETLEQRAGLLGWALTRWLGGVVDPGEPTEHTRALFDEWLLGRTLQKTFVELGLENGAAIRASGLTQILFCHERALIDADDESPRHVFESLLRDSDVRDFLGVNRYRDVLWFSQERFNDLVGGLLAAAVVTVAVESPSDGASAAEDDTTADRVEAASALARSFKEAEEQSGYQLDRLLRSLPA
jgi:glycosidase